MTTLEQCKKADDFLAMHQAPELLILPNAWDVVSARLYLTEGFKAIATTSAGVAAVLGYPDGERIRRDEMVEAVGRIASRLDVPLSADMETGYGNSPAPTPCALAPATPPCRRAASRRSPSRRTANAGRC